MVFFALGAGPIPFLYLPEVLPQEIMGTAQVGGSVRWVAGWVGGWLGGRAGGWVGGWGRLRFLGVGSKCVCDVCGV